MLYSNDEQQIRDLLAAEIADNVKKDIICVIGRDNMDKEKWNLELSDYIKQGELEEQEKGLIERKNGKRDGEWIIINN